MDMHGDTRPSETALRDMLWRKIKGSKLTIIDLSLYENMAYDNPEQTYQKLLASHHDLLHRHVEVVFE